MADESTPAEDLGGHDPEEIRLTEEARSRPPVDRLDPMAVLSGVPVSWLAQVFRSYPKAVKARLEKAPVVRVSEKYGPYYDLAVAASYLVEPKQPAADWLAAATPKALAQVLPMSYQAQFWSAMHRRTAAMREAGELWHRDDIAHATAQMLMLLREGLLALPSDIGRRAGLTAEQQKLVREAVHALLDRMRSRYEAQLTEWGMPSYMETVLKLERAADAMRRRAAGLRPEPGDDEALEVIKEAGLALPVFDDAADAPGEPDAVQDDEAEEPDAVRSALARIGVRRRRRERDKSS